MKWVLILLVAIPVVGLPQSRPASKKAAAPKKGAEAPAELPTRWPIIALNVDGNHRYPTAAILAVAGLKVGQVAGKEEFDAARERLMTSGYFEMAGYKFDPATNQNGIVGTFQVTEVDMVYPARFEDLGVPAAELEKIFRARDPLFSSNALPATKPVLDRL